MWERNTQFQLLCTKWVCDTKLRPKAYSIHIKIKLIIAFGVLHYIVTLISYYQILNLKNIDGKEIIFRSCSGGSIVLNFLWYKPIQQFKDDSESDIELCFITPNRKLCHAGLCGALDRSISFGFKYGVAPSLWLISNYGRTTERTLWLIWCEYQRRNNKSPNSYYWVKKILVLFGQMRLLGNTRPY